MNQAKIRSLQYIRRFNFERCNRYQTVAEHSLMVGFLCLDVARAIGLSDWVANELAMAGMLHDAEEAATGDLPYLVRRALGPEVVGALEEAAQEELGLEGYRGHLGGLVDFCDALELAMYIREEEDSGSYSLEAVYWETAGRLVSSSWWGDPRVQGWALSLLGVDGVDLPAFEDRASRASFSGLKH